ncbi:MAG TPA: COR domain-containing protein [Candidatus Kapabacteria bacterium]|nr:COR domain-containing protein [Candidatus Kapabacteria bacterium]
MAQDLKLIEQLEKETGRKLNKYSLEDEENTFDYFTVYPEGHVVVIGLYKIEKMAALLPIILKFQHLKILNLSFTGLEDISGLKELQGLKALYLFDNKIRDISSLKELQGLTELGLGGNQIRDISIHKYLRGLTGLYLWKNQISDVSSLKELQGLTYLDLSRNQISDISSLLELKHLTLLDLRENKITHLPAEVLNLGLEIKWERKEKKNETGLFLEGNPLESPPPEIVQKGTKAVREYFKAMKGEGEMQALKEVKVLLVGDGAAGKTSLVKQLRGDPFDKNESQTHGINIASWETGPEDFKINVRLWDFGGQEIMHATHQFFLSKRSLYILVLDSRKEEKTEYWLNHVRTFGGSSPVLVVLNKMDENPGFDVNRRFLLEKYPNIKGFYPISCAKGKGIAAFKKALNRELANVELIRTTWAKHWFNVKSRLEHMTDNFITYDRYREICSEENIPNGTAQDTLVDYLNDLGVILHFKDFHLKETQVLEPRWITTAVYKIINSPILAAGHGSLDLLSLKEILKPLPGEKPGFTYPPDKYPYIIELMKKFELCYALDDEHILTPDLLAVGEPKIDFDRDDALEFRYHYNFLPKSIMPRFMVKRRRDIKDELRWRTGVVLEDRDCEATALIKADEREHKIFISVAGTRKRDYFAVIRNTFQELHDSFEKLAVEEWIPLPDNDKIAVEYRELLGYEKAGRDDYFVGKLEKSYSVAKLLSGIETPEDRRDRQPRVIEREIIKVQTEQPVSAQEKTKRFPLFWKIAASIGGLIAFLAALAAIFDSQAAKKFWDWVAYLFNNN